MFLKSFAKKIVRKYMLKESSSLIMNINRDITKKQKRVLISYTTLSLHSDFDHGAIFHPNIPRCNQIIKQFIDLGFAIDICDSNDTDALSKIEDIEYNIVFGFGKVFDAAARKCKCNILYITENAPEVISRKVSERIVYLKERHPGINYKYKQIRNTYYTQHMFDIADYGIIMTNEYNAAAMLKNFNKYYMINVNGLYNAKFHYEARIIPQNKKSFLWFGSNGLLPKGLDIIIDAFRQLPEYTLSVYGAPLKELKNLRIDIPKNVHLCGRIRIDSEEFIKVVKSHSFIISASCMEGMQSGIASCMLHGLIPVVTKECGYTPQRFIIQLDNYKVETIADTVKKLGRLPDDKLISLSQSCFEYAHKTFTLNSFSTNFKYIIEDIVKFQHTSISK